MFRRPCSDHRHTSALSSSVCTARLCHPLSLLRRYAVTFCQETVAMGEDVPWYIAHDSLEPCSMRNTQHTLTLAEHDAHDCSVTQLVPACNGNMREGRRINSRSNKFAILSGCKQQEHTFLSSSGCACQMHKGCKKWAPMHGNSCHECHCNISSS